MFTYKNNKAASRKFMSKGKHDGRKISNLLKHGRKY